MNESIKSLYDFIDSAVKSRKYPESTAQTLRAAIKLYEQELNEEEIGSISLFRKNIDQIAQAVFNKNKLKFSAASLATYKSRVLKVLNDYESYGVDPAKMASWTPKVIARAKRAKVKEEPGNAIAGDGGEQQHGNTVPSNMHKIELALRADSPVTLILPRDLQVSEVATITAILNSLTVNTRAQNEKEENL